MNELGYISNFTVFLREMGWFQGTDCTDELETFLDGDLELKKGTFF